MRKAAKIDRVGAIAVEVEALEGQLRDDTQTNLETYCNEIVEMIENDIVLRHHYAAGVIEHTLADDPEIRRAVALLDTPEEYARIVTSQDTQRK